MAGSRSEFAPGDLLGFQGRDLVSVAVNLYTRGWPFPWPASWAGLSHVAVVGQHPNNPGELALYESTTGCRLPCLSCGAPVNGVQCHAIEERLASYDGLKFHYPMTAAAREFFNEKAAQAFLSRAMHRPYDYSQALNAREGIFGWLARRLYPVDAAAAYYCSELIAGSWSAGLGQLRSRQWNPNRLVRLAREIGIVDERRLLP